MAILFPFTPNWASAYKVESAYKTEIITNRDYSEQRFALRSQPRRGLSFVVSPARGRLREFSNLMASRQQAEFVVPEITRHWLVAEEALATTNIIVPDAGVVPPWAAPGTHLVIERTDGRELVLIVSADPLGIVLDQPLAATVPPGSRFYPGLVGRFDQGIRGQFYTNTTGQFTMNFDADPGLNFHEPDTAAPVSFNGKELFLKKPNWRSAPIVSLDGLLETTDYGRGRLNHFSSVAYNHLSLRMEFLQRDAAEAEALSQFFHRQRGQQGEFYAPTWGDDFDLSIGAASGASSLVVPGLDTVNLFSANLVYRAVVVFFRDGTYQANRITTLAAAGSNSALSFAAPWTRAINPGTVRQMCWLPVWRLAIDSLTLDWQTRTVAQTQLTLKALGSPA